MEPMIVMGVQLLNHQGKTATDVVVSMCTSHAGWQLCGQGLIKDGARPKGHKAKACFIVPTARWCDTYGTALLVQMLPRLAQGKAMGRVFKEALAEVEETVLSRCRGTGEALGTDHLMVSNQCTTGNLDYLRTTLGYLPDRRGVAKVALDGGWGTWAKKVRDMWFDENFQIRSQGWSSNRDSQCICCGADGFNKCLAEMHVTWGWLID
jgi:hypothetical protein